MRRWWERRRPGSAVSVILKRWRKRARTPPRGRLRAAAPPPSAGSPWLGPPESPGSSPHPPGKVAESSPRRIFKAGKICFWDHRLWLRCQEVSRPPIWGFKEPCLDLVSFVLSSLWMWVALEGKITGGGGGGDPFPTIFLKRRAGVEL